MVPTVVSTRGGEDLVAVFTGRGNGSFVVSTRGGKGSVVVFTMECLVIVFRVFLFTDVFGWVGNGLDVVPTGRKNTSVVLSTRGGKGSVVVLAMEDFSIPFGEIFWTVVASVVN